MLLTKTMQLLKLLLHLLLLLYQVLLLNLILLIRETLYVRLNLAQAIIHSATKRYFTCCTRNLTSVRISRKYTIALAALSSSFL